MVTPDEPVTPGAHQEPEVAVLQIPESAPTNSTNTAV
jgi:hypothetical protein